MPTADERTTAAHRAGCLVERTSGQKCDCGAARATARSSVTAWERWPEQPPISADVIGGCEPLIEAVEPPYMGMRTIEVQCPYCNAAPFETCRNMRTVGTGGGGQPGFASHGQPHVHVPLRRPHPERIDAARRGQTRAD